ncbi:hypothetical protein AVEN_261591-1 [Araneus ventricosus]|uniref:Histone-lysine N-methyltransferase SETMAR n=1 Tax=Araneus ventricosus TaxID=182803 RepID=A0A4Y2RTF0_ARAVE|nr:hypothetical protein AVEN_261591-1 [Araneus ventricosus]
MTKYEGKSLTPQFHLHKILWVAVSSTVGLHVERRHHLQSVCLQDVVLEDQTDKNMLGAKSGWSVLQHPPYRPDLSLFGLLKQHLGGKHFADDDDGLLSKAIRKASGCRTFICFKSVFLPTEDFPKSTADQVSPSPPLNCG